MLNKIVELLDMIKFQHTVFALPFALLSAFLAAGGLPPGRVLFFILAAMVTARSCAMAFNRIIDARFDAQNPRTAARSVPAGRIGLGAAWTFTIVMAVLFVASAWALNRLCLYLAPVALGIVLGYSFTKRFTNLSHLVLGLALSVAPVGAWLAVTGAFAFPPLLLAAAVLCWTAGFDIIYACQDIEFDRRAGLYSIPKALGVVWALRISTVLHAAMAGLLLGMPLCSDLGMPFVVGVIAVAVLLAYEHWLVKPDDLSRVSTAFFTINGMVSVALACVGIADILLT
ncbi:MAG: UbiA family prenyltransferase [Planctomycetes bacterium]|nr:UbiA family prenyltransferase [Planctomycetota bacterium]